jgi:formylglycine-generating enzyme required for sulfatase activity
LITRGRGTGLARPRLASHPVSCGEYLEFIADGGYRRAEFWLSEGWAIVQREGWQAPPYWRSEDNEWRIFTLAGERRIEPAEPVCHVSFYEADAFARWAGRRLPTEAAWEVASRVRSPAISPTAVTTTLSGPAPTAGVPELAR